MKNPTEFLFLTSYIVPMVFEIFLPCYFGQLLHDAYHKLGTSLYASAWVSANRNFTNSIKVVMENFKGAVKISAFGVVHVDLQTFGRIINSAFSLYAVLKSL